MSAELMRPDRELALETRYRRSLSHLARVKRLLSYNLQSGALKGMLRVAEGAIEEIENEFLADDPAYSEFLSRCARQEEVSLALADEGFEASVDDLRRAGVL